MNASPLSFSQALVNVGLLQNLPPQLVLLSDGQRKLWNGAQTVLVPGMLTLWLEDHSKHPDELAALLRGKEAREGKLTAYLCHNSVCNLPVHDAGELTKELSAVVAAESAPQKSS
jgi:uncharacterized protein YyaL (SSP411 family)